MLNKRQTIPFLLRKTTQTLKPDLYNTSQILAFSCAVKRSISSSTFSNVRVC